MPGNNSHLESPLLEENDYSGRLFHVNFLNTDNPDWSYLRSELEDAEIQFEDNAGVEDEEDLYVAPLYEGGQDDPWTATVENVQEICDSGLKGVLGQLSYYESDTVRYDGRPVLTLDHQERKFLVFEYGGLAFLLILAPRDSLMTLYHVFSDILADLDLITDDISITPSEFDSLGDSLIDEHRMTSVDGYTESKIDKKHIIGRGYGESEEYLREKREGSVRGQRFGTSQLDTKSKTIQISEDCLIRSYNNITLSMYLSLITVHIIPCLELSIQTSLSGYGSGESRVQAKQITDY